MNVFGLLALAKCSEKKSGKWPLDRSALLAEVRYGNRFFLKMQDGDGQVWSDVGGGLNGDNSDNHWTDNTVGTSDDRWINVQKRNSVQAMFVCGEAMISQAFIGQDAIYSKACMNAALRCWDACSHVGSNTTDVAWWTLAAIEMYAATGRSDSRDEIARLADVIAGAQVTRPNAGSTVRGFFPMWIGSQEPLSDPVHSGLPAYVLLRAAEALGNVSKFSALSQKWSSAAKLYIDEYLSPMAALSAYQIIPFGLFLNQRSPENYRPMGGGYTYRFFMPIKKTKWWVGVNAHLLCHAMLLSHASRHFENANYRALAFAQLEWVFGGNPFGASLATGIGRNNPTAFSPLVGPITGGIMNGVAGNENDQPILDQLNPQNWNTNEYWSTHNGYCEWALASLEG